MEVVSHRTGQSDRSSSFAIFACDERLVRDFHGECMSLGTEAQSSQSAHAAHKTSLAADLTGELEIRRVVLAAFTSFGCRDERRHRHVATSAREAGREASESKESEFARSRGDRGGQSLSSSLGIAD
jgi:hypothetical protein